MGRGMDVDKLWEQCLERTTETIELEFIGVAVYVNFPCECELCKKGEEALVERGGKGRRGLQLHIMIQPLNVPWEIQHVYIDMERAWKFSRKNAFRHACEQCGIPVRPFEEFKKFLMSNIVEWKKTTVKDYFESVGEKVPDLDNMPERQRQTVMNALNAQVIVPVKVIPMDALELYELDRDEVKFKVKLGRKIAPLLAEGRPKEEIQRIVAKLTEEYMEEKEKEEEEETEEEEEEEVKKAKKTKKTKKAKKEEEKIEETEEEEEEEFL